MQLIPVVDLAGGLAVHGRAGDRARYVAVESVLTPDRPGDPVALVQAYRDRVAARECYVADLDAIRGDELQADKLRELVTAAVPCTLLVDAGSSRPAEVAEVLALGAAAVVVGLETLRGFQDLRAGLGVAGPPRVIFSLDLRLGCPMLHPELAAELGDPTADALAALAVDAGVRTLLVLDVGRVGTGGGVDLELLRRLRRQAPSVRLLAGGGVAGAEDLRRLADVGCDGALVATALHTGRIGQSSASTSCQVADCP